MVVRVGCVSEVAGLEGVAASFYASATVSVVSDDARARRAQPPVLVLTFEA